MTIGATERRDELLAIVGGPHRQVGEIQPCRPPVGPLVERGHAPGRQAEPEGRVHQGGRLLGRELEVSRPEFGQLLGRPKPGDRQRRIRTRRDGKLDARRGELDQAHDRFVAFVGVDDVVVVEDEHHAGRGRLQLGEAARLRDRVRGRALRAAFAASSPPVARPSAAPMYVQSTVGSLSCRSIATQAKVRGSTSAQSASSDVFPKPGRRNHDGERGPSGDERPRQSRPTDGPVAQDRRMHLRCLKNWPTARHPGRFRGSCRHATPTSRARGPQVQPDDGRWHNVHQRSSDGPARAAHDACARIGRAHVECRWGSR